MAPLCVFTIGQQSRRKSHLNSRRVKMIQQFVNITAD